MRIRMSSRDCGSYSHVYIDKVNKRAIKIFKRTKDEERFRRVFNSEIEAYRLASISEEINSLIPKFFGTRIVDELISIDGSDMTNEIINDCAYEIEYIPGEFWKINDAPISTSEKERIRQMFRTAGISYTIDSSCVFDEHGKITCVIDFGTEEFESWHC